MGELNTCLLPEAKQREKLGSILNFEKCERFYGDFHPQVPKHTKNFEGFHEKQHVERKLGRSEEVVKYMSYLPSFLEKGENPQEKPFNIGVLDWHQLEKWQCNSNHISGINSKHPQFTSNNSSFITSEGLSSHCCRENMLFPHQQGVNHHALSCHSNATPTEGCSSSTKLLAGNGVKFPDGKACSINPLKAQQSVLQASQSSSLDTLNGLIDRKSKDSAQGRVPGTRWRHFEKDSIISGLKGNDGMQKREALKAERLVPSFIVTDHDFSERHRPVVLESTDDTGNRHFSLDHKSEFKVDNNRSLQANCHSCSRGYTGNFCHIEFASDCACFHSLPDGSGKTKGAHVKQSCAKEIRSINCPSGKEQTIPLTGSEISPCIRKKLEEKNSGSKPRNLAEEKVFQVKVSIADSTTVENSSPTHHFSSGVGRICNSSSSNSLAIPYPVSRDDPKVTSTSASSSNSTCEKSNATSRSRSSPLRRLLDPLLKPRGSDSHDFDRSSERNPLKTDKTKKSSGSQRESPALHSIKIRFDLKGCKTDDIIGTHKAEKNGLVMMQALLQVAVKNGNPLFTFTVDNCTNILAATVKKLSSKKTAPRWVYTFFSFNEMKKKNASWKNQGCKDRNHGYIPNIVAQMKVSDILCTNSNGKRPVSKSCVREFVLSSMGTQDIDQKSGPLTGDDELAAIVVKFLERVDEQSKEDGQWRGTFNKLSVIGLNEPFQEVKSCSNSKDDKGNESASNDIFSLTVILPSGHHGMPSNGEPWPLIERWKSGGSCDCGGWDLGCRIRVLANSNQSSQRSNLAKSQSSTFKLFSQEETEEKKRPVFIYSPFEDGIFSIEFNSSLNLLQAFSIGISVLNSRTSAMLSTNAFGVKISEEIT
ncbi:UNVERIFIED_CONTAM: hypothetical protein Sindi_0600000 [Sesamum indicum]